MALLTLEEEEQFTNGIYNHTKGEQIHEKVRDIDTMESLLHKLEEVSQLTNENAESLKMFLYTHAYHDKSLVIGNVEFLTRFEQLVGKLHERTETFFEEMINTYAETCSLDANFLI